LSGVKEKVNEGFRNQLTEGFNTRKLNNIKCYPIDLASQVDDQGNIVIDEITNKPIDPKEATESADMDMNVDLEADVSGVNNTTYWIFFGIFIVLLIGFAVTIMVFTFRGKSVVAPVPSWPCELSPAQFRSVLPTKHMCSPPAITDPPYCHGAARVTEALATGVVWPGRPSNVMTPTARAITAVNRDKRRKTDTGTPLSRPIF
jgi:hypothetical protein